VVRTLGWLIWDTFRQSLANRLFWLMLGVTILSVVFCLSISVPESAPVRDPKDPLGELYLPNDQSLAEAVAKGEHVSSGAMTVGFGLMQVDFFRDSQSQVQFIRLVMAIGVAGVVGTLLILIFTGGFLPEFLQPSAASVLLAKPAPRWILLVGKYLGVMTFVAFHAALFVGLTWAAIGIRTSDWSPEYLLAFPLVLVHVGMIYGFSAFVGVLTRNPIAAVFGAVVFWVMCFATNYARHSAVALPEITRIERQNQLELERGRKITEEAEARAKARAEERKAKGLPEVEEMELGMEIVPGVAGLDPESTADPHLAQGDLEEPKANSDGERNEGARAVYEVAQHSSGLKWFTELSYWIMPKPADLAIVLERGIVGDLTHFASPQEFETVINMGEFHAGWSIASSLLMTLFWLGLAIHEFSKMDY
jgi:ABC-type transport system involved in multi-copper enzyme maturation permease subunit